MHLDIVKAFPLIILELQIGWCLLLYVLHWSMISRRFELYMEIIFLLIWYESIFKYMVCCNLGTMDLVMPLWMNFFQVWFFFLFENQLIYFNARFFHFPWFGMVQWVLPV